MSIPVWRRFGSSGTVVVTGVASQLSANTLPSQAVPATPSIDFPSVPISVTFEEGVTTAFFNITLLDNNRASSLKVFQFTLTSVVSRATSEVAPQSPRLSSVNTTARITIIDDEGGAGQFQLNPTTATVAEGSTLTFSVLRSGGASGSISVLLQTVDSGLATSGTDFQALNQLLTFEDGTSQLLQSVDIIDDSDPEGPEDFLVTLSIPTGEMLVDTNAVCQQMVNYVNYFTLFPLLPQNSLRVIIEASDNPAGVFSFITASLRLSEDGPASGELEVRRTDRLAGVVVITWEAIYTDGEEHAVPLSEILVSTTGTISFPDNSATSDSNIELQLIPNGVSLLHFKKMIFYCLVDCT